MLKESNKEEASLSDVRTYKNRNQEDNGNFLALRVFGRKFRDEVTHESLETLALTGV